jgi:hypothetical protein
VASRVVGDDADSDRFFGVLKRSFLFIPSEQEEGKRKRNRAKWRGN